MDERDKDAARPQSTNQRILHDLRVIQAELELVRVHCIELEKIVMMTMIDKENKLQK